MKKSFLFRMTIVAVCALFCNLKASAQEAYAVISSDMKELTFFYDYDKASRKGMNMEQYTNGYGQRVYDWSTYKFEVTKVVFDNSFAACTSITSTNRYFYDFNKLETIVGIENLNTSNVTDMNSMFAYCRSLKSLNLSSFDTSNVTDMTCMFDCCEKLATLNISNFNTEKVTTFYNMFSNCNSLKSLDVSHFNTEKATNMCGMFSNCKLLTSLDVSHFDTTNVVEMSCMFFYCSSLTSLDVSNFNTENNMSIASMFSGCSSLTSLDLSSFNTAKVISMDNLFCNCSSLQSIDLSSFNTESLLSAPAMFSGCTSLTTLNLGNFNTASLEYLYSMFEDCQSLTSLDLSSFNTENVKYINAMFKNCSNLKTILVDAEDWKTDNVIESEDMFTGCTSIVGGNGTTYDDSHTDKEYARIDEYGWPGYLSTTPLEGYAALSEGNSVLTFYCDRKKVKRNGMSIHPFTLSIDSRVDSGWDSYREQIKKVTFDISFNAEYEQVTSTALWFYGFSNLETVENLNYLITLNVEDMNHMFAGCRSLKSLNVDNLVWNRAKDLSYLFYNCESLTSLDLRTWGVRDLTGRYQMTNLSHMFDGCRSLTSLDLSLLDTWKVTDMSFMFANCESLTNLRFIQNNQLYFDTNEVTDMSYMFANCKNLKDLDVNVFKTHSLENMDGMFMLCENMKTIDISGLQTSGVTSMKNMFNSCYNLKTIYVTLYWNTSNVTESTDMFKDSEKLVGGAGTKYNASYTDKEYARIDKPGQPGYLTDKNATGIESLTTDPSSKSNESYYTLDGRVLNGEPVQKGVYIFNGKKVIR